VTFWSSQRLEANLTGLVEPSEPASVDCNAIRLRVGEEIFVTPHMDEVYSATKRRLTDREAFQVPPEQFVFILTEETVRVPPDAMAFISMRGTFKMQGLINVSGFHVDPGWNGKLVFAVYNAGPSPVHLERGLPIFLVWYADLDNPSEKRKTESGHNTIPPERISHLTNATDSLFALNTRLNTERDERRSETSKLVERVHSVEKQQSKIMIFAGIIATIAIGLLAWTLRSEITALISSLADKAPKT